MSQMQGMRLDRLPIEPTGSSLAEKVDEVAGHGSQKHLQLHIYLYIHI